MSAAFHCSGVRTIGSVDARRPEVSETVAVCNIPSCRYIPTSIARDGVIHDLSIANLEPMDVRNVDSPASGRHFDEKASIQRQMSYSSVCATDSAQRDDVVRLGGQVGRFPCASQEMVWRMSSIPV
jgi:hypothetical protein